MRVFALAVALGISGICQAANPESVPEVQKQLRAIETGILRGEADSLRLGFEEEARNRPGDVMLRVYLAWTSIPSDDAWNALKGIASVNPENPWPHLGMGRIYTRWKMRDQAEAELRGVLKSNPRFYPALSALGDLARANGNLDNAEARYREALAIQDDAEAHAGLGLVLVARGKAEEARKELAHALELFPEQPEALSALAKLARDAKDNAAAEKYVSKLTELTPKDREARRMLADLRFEMGQKEAAAKEYEAVLRLGAPDSDVLKRLVAIDAELKNAEGEEHALNQLAGLDKQSPDAPIRLAELAEERGALEEAEGQLQEASHRAPDRTDLLLRLARLQVKRNELREARETYLAADAAPGDKPPELKSELAEVTARLKLPKRPPHGSVDQIYAQVSATLNALYAERLKEKPDLGGVLRLRVTVDAKGKATAVDAVEDSVGDPIIGGHLYFVLKDATYPKAKREPLFEFELKPPQKGK